MAKNRMKGSGGQTDDGREEEPEQDQAQTSQVPATQTVNPNYSLGAMMSRIGAAQAGQPLNTAAAPLPDRSAMIQRVMTGPATEGPASSAEPPQNAMLQQILARLSQQRPGY